MNIEMFDSWLDMSGPVAVTLREELEPAMGADSVLFPPTFAPPEGSKDAPSYLIDETSDGKVALVDTVGSQANRLEPIFKDPPYAELVPQATVRIGERQVHLLDAGHRAADAVIRFSDQWAVLRGAFASIREQRDALPLARLAPTSLVFGVWDSRDTQVKMPRLIGSTIRAYKVEKLTRSAQYFAALDKEELQDLGAQKQLSELGLDDAPAGRTDGGVIAREGVRRETQLNLVALRALSTVDAEGTLKLRRYILGLALVTLTAQPQRFLREGCLLVPKEGSGPVVKTVGRDGVRQDLQLTSEAALEFARLAAADFGVGAAWEATFDKAAVTKATSAKAASGKEAKSKKG